MNKIQRVLAFLIGFLVPVFLLAATKGSIRDYKKGLEFYGQGRYEQALERFELAIDGNFNFWQSYQMVGYCYFELRDKEAALQAFQESLKINPQNPQLARIYNDLKSGTLDIPVRPVAEPLPVGTPVEIQTYYTYNR